MSSLFHRLRTLALFPALFPALLLGSCWTHAQTTLPVSVPLPTLAPEANFTLQDALAGLSASAQYRQAQLSLSAAQVQAQAALAATGVTAGLSAGLNYGTVTTTGSSGTATENTSVTESLGAAASLPVLPWATAILAAQSAARGLAVAQVAFAQAVAALRTSTEQTYGRAVTAQLNLSIARDTLSVSQRQLAQVTAFQASNNATVQSVQAAQAAVQTAVVAVQSSQNELDSARRALGTLVGRDLSGAVFGRDLSATLAGVVLPSQAAALSAAQVFSPALASAQKAVTDAQVAVTSAERARRLPAATVNAGFGPGSGNARSGLSASLNVQTGLLSASYTQPLQPGGGAASLSLGLNASFNVLDPAADGTLRLAQTQLQQAQTAVTVQQASITQSLLDAYAAAQLAAQSIAPRQTSVTAYTTALATAQARLAAGLSTETDVLNAQIALAQAERDLNTAQITALTSAAQLSSLTGLAGGP